MTRSPLIPFRHRIAIFLCLVAFTSASPGCYTYHVYQVGGPSSRELGNQPSTEWRHKTLNALAWGAVRQDLPIDNCQLPDSQRFGIEEIKIETNMGYVLASAATLGLWSPLEVSWRCARPHGATGTLD